MFTKTSTTSIIAVILTIGGICLLSYLAWRYGDDATTRTQIITGLLTTLAGPAGYYFGNTKQRTSNINTDSIGTVNTAPTDTPSTTT